MVLSELCPVVKAQQAEFYVVDSEGDGKLTLLASFASEGQQELGKKIGLGEGAIGQCALEKEKIVLNNLPPDYLRISSGLGEASPRSVLVLPLIFEGQVKGVLELASFEGFNPTDQALLDQLTESIGIVLNTIEANMRTEDLLTQSQSLAQQLQTRQEQLQLTNAELEEKAHLLAQQNQEVELKNQEVEQARQELEVKAKQLALTSKYKSEFLANMSHELRTPLNSLLLISDQLNKNTEGNLTGKQVEHAKTIHSSGKDLLMLINDILDLSKIESGTVMVECGELRLDDLHGYVSRTFKHVAESKNVGFEIQFASQLPRAMFTDSKRLQQIIKNLLSNAFKFTHHGQVTFSVEPVQSGWGLDNDELNRASEVLAFSVADTGIGIAADKQMIIFEAFQQADGSTSRKYGGTGLGLAISRELSRLLGGEIRLNSAPNKGSTFTLFLPVTYDPPRTRKQQNVAEAITARTAPEVPEVVEPFDTMTTEAEIGYLVNEVGDDRNYIQPGDMVILIVENDLGFARFLLDKARQKGCKGLVTSLGAVALALTHDYKPDIVLLDINLLDMQGWRVLERLKHDDSTRHIPVCVISTQDSRDRALASSALAFIAKPLESEDVLDTMFDQLTGFIEQPQKQVVIVEPNAKRREQIRDAIASDDLKITPFASVKAAEKALLKQHADCLIINPGQLELLQHLIDREDENEKVRTRIPAIIYGEDEIDADTRNHLRNLCSLAEARTPERLLDLTNLFLHRDIAKLPDAQRNKILSLHQSDKLLANKRVLIVDDDMRNIFALSSILEEHQMVIVSADNGHDAIEILQKDRDIDIVLMDIMMPEMDGMETMREIRKIPYLKNLPIVAVTAKAMKGDREKCIEAGAWDYLSKPVDMEQMLAVLRAWLHQEP